jgi:hypothetical protein
LAEANGNGFKSKLVVTLTDLPFQIYKQQKSSAPGFNYDFKEL